MKTFAFILLLVLLLGCSSVRDPWAGYISQSGDLSSFITGCATKYGGHPITDRLPIIQTEWRYKADKQGVATYLIGDHGTEIQSLLTRAFGAPDSGRGSSSLAPDSKPGGQDGWYSHLQLDISIYFFSDTNETGVIILRGKT